MFLSIPLHPLFPATVALMAGICVAQGTIHAIWLATCSLFLLHKSHQLRVFNIAFVCVAGTVGFFTMYHQVHQFESAATLCTHAVAIRGTIISITPQTKKQGEILLIQTTHIIDKNQQTIPLDTMIQLRTNQPLTTVAGDSVSIAPLKLQIPHGSFARYAMKEGFVATGTITKKTMVTVRASAPYLTGIRTKIRANLAKNIAQKMTAASSALFALIFLGQKQTLHTIKETFARWGLVHQLARSGLHLVLFIMILRWLLGHIPAPYRFKQTLLLLFVLCYSLLSWSTVSFMRAITTFILYFAYDISGAQINAIQLLTLAVWIILIPCPVQLFFLDFQLSFGLSYALLLITSAQQQRRVGVNQDREPRAHESDLARVPDAH